MMFNMAARNLYRIVFVLLSIILPAVNTAFSADLPAKSLKLPSTQAEAKTNPSGWGTLLEFAKKENKVKIYTALGNSGRQAVDNAFTSKYEIALEWLSGRGSEQITKAETERRAGIYSGDVLMAGVTSQMLFKEKGFLESLDRVLVLPEVKDPRQWMDGKLPFIDNEHMMISYFMHAGTSVVINTTLVQGEEIKSYLDLLAPKWKGKIVMQDPTVSGSGNAFFAMNIMEIMGKEFAYKLARQEPVIVRDQRLALEWVARGKYPLVLAPEPSLLSIITKAGAPLKHIVLREGTYRGGGPGGLALLNKTGHPNAAKLFINWLLSREGQTVIAKAERDQSRRLDVPTDFIDLNRRIDPNVKYIDSDAEEYLLKRKTSVKLAKEIFGPYMQ